MNAKERKAIEALVQRVEGCRDDLESYRDAEQEKFDNLSDGLQQAESGQQIETVARALDDAYGHLEDAIQALIDAKQA